MAGKIDKSAFVGIVGTLVIALLMVMAYRFDQLPLISGGHTMSADFKEVGGLKSGDEVIISGTAVGKVDSMKIVDGHAHVKFTLKVDHRLGTQTSARVVTQTLLGAAALEVVPTGPGRLAGNAVIPLSRTTSPYDVTQALSELTTTSNEIDKDQLTRAIGSVSDTFSGTPEDLKGALRGLTKVSNTIDENDTALLDLLKQARNVSGTLSARNKEITTLLSAGNSLLAQLNERDKVIVALLYDAEDLSNQLNALVKENGKELKPAFTQLNKVIDQLNANKRNLELTIDGVASYATELGEAVTTGPFFDAYVENLTSLQTVAPVLSGVLSQ